VPLSTPSYATVTGDRLVISTIEHRAIGAALGAPIGAVVDGGKGAAIGAGGGAGTVMIEGRDRLDLPRGTEVTLTSSGPGRLRTGQGAQRHTPRWAIGKAVRR